MRVFLIHPFLRPVSLQNANKTDYETRQELQKYVKLM